MKTEIDIRAQIKALVSRLESGRWSYEAERIFRSEIRTLRWVLGEIPFDWKMCEIGDKL